MANSLLTVRDITRRALMILHQKLNFIGNVNRQYDDRFARAGAKIGTTLDVRLPNKYVVRNGATMVPQDTVERSVQLPVSNQKGVDLNFTSVDLTMSIDDFSDRIIEPAMAVLASNIEYDVMSTLYKQVANTVGSPTSQLSLRTVLQSGQRLTENLAPRDKNRSFLINPASNTELVDALKGLFQDSAQVSKQYMEGIMGKTGGYTFFENTLLPVHTPGSKPGTPLVNLGGQGNPGTNNAYVSTSSINTKGWTASQSGILKAGDVLTFGGVFAIHPETRQPYGYLQQFVVQADVNSDGSGNAAVVVSPALITGGAYQTVSGSPADNAPIVVVGTASTAYAQNLAFHRDAFIFATADLVMPEGVDFAYRAVMDGISLRIVRQYDIANDKFPCRVDVLYGSTIGHRELGCRVIHQP